MSQRGGKRPGAGRPATGTNPKLGIRVPHHIASAVRRDPKGAREALRKWALSMEIKPSE